jgi:hypothetical protein
VPEVETSTPANTPEPIGPYSHIAKVGSLITIGGTAGVNPVTGQLAGTEIGSHRAADDESHRRDRGLKQPGRSTEPRTGQRDPS